MRRTGVLAAAAMLGATLAVVTAAPGGASPTARPGAVKPWPAESELARFPVYDASGNKLRDALWRLTDAGGNCCEVFVAATPQGRLLEFGGMDPLYSDDRGVTWHTVLQDVPRTGGEGAISAAPNGDIVGVVWNLDSADLLQSYKYDAATRAWSYDEVPLHHPLFDRPWIAVVPGPFTLVDETTAPYATVVRSNYMSTAYDAFYVSFDGLTYLPSTDEAVQATGPLVTGYVEPAANPMMDYLQPNPSMRVMPLARGGFVNIAASRGNDTCPATRYGKDQQWTCIEIPGHELGDVLRTDSRGWLHEVTQMAPALFRYAVSPDGGRTWQHTDLVLPTGGVTGARMIDVQANGALGAAVVAVHGSDGSASQDVVFKVDVASSQPRLRETMLVGQGDRLTGSGITELGPRFDFASLALLPDGTVAVAFDDSTHGDPRLAIEVPEEWTPPTPPAATPTAVGESPDVTPETSFTPSPEALPSATATETATPSPSATSPSPTATATPGAAPYPEPAMDTTAPAASAVLPVRLTDSAVVRFDERVTGVSGIVLRLAGGGAVPTTRRCRDGAATVACDGPLTEVELRPSAPLRPGERYVLAAGTARDAAGNAAAATAFAFRGSLVEDQASRAASYSWPVVATRDALGGSYAVERRAGAVASYPFTGTSVTWIGAAGPDQGRVDVLVDGVRRATVDTYAPAPRWRIARTVGALPQGRHVLTLRVRGDRAARSRGTAVVLDAVRAASGTMAATPVWDAAWCTAASGWFAGGSAAVADLAGAQVTFAFRGTGVDWLTMTAPGAGRARVYLDGRLYAVVDNDSRSRRYGVRRSVTGLTDTVHHVSVRLVGDGPVAVDRWLVR